jgi:hypothetical protein
MTNNPITTPFGAQSTADQVIAGVDLRGKRAIVTGGSSGIGIETARALASAGAEVTLAVRNLEAGRRTADDITASWDGPLDLLINNAGVMALPDLQLTPEGWEMQFAELALGLQASRSLSEASERAGIPNSVRGIPESSKRPLPPAHIAHIPPAFPRGSDPSGSGGPAHPPGRTAHLVKTGCDRSNERNDDDD